MIDGQCWIGVSDDTSIVSFGNEAVLLMEGLGVDEFADGLCAIQW